MFGDFLQAFKIPGPDMRQTPTAGRPAPLPAAQPTDQVGIASPEAPAAGVAPVSTAPAQPAMSPLSPPTPLGAR